MGYEELFPTNDLKGWHANAAKRFASPFVDNYHDRIDVDPIILSNAAVQCGFTIRDFYEKPELGIHSVGYISELFDLLPVHTGSSHSRGSEISESHWSTRTLCRQFPQDL